MNNTFWIKIKSKAPDRNNEPIIYEAERISAHKIIIISESFKNMVLRYSEIEIVTRKELNNIKKRKLIKQMGYDEK